MAEPLLVPAWPDVMRFALPCIVTRGSARGPGRGRTFAAAWIGVLDGERFIVRSHALDAGVFSPGMEQLGDEAVVELDLRDDATRDHLVRRLLLATHPALAGVSLNPPHFHVGTGDGVLLWWFTVSDSHGIGRSTDVAIVPAGPLQDELMARHGEARRLLSLAAVLCATFGAKS